MVSCFKVIPSFSRRSRVTHRDCHSRTSPTPNCFQRCRSQVHPWTCHAASEDVRQWGSVWRQRSRLGALPRRRPLRRPYPVEYGRLWNESHWLSCEGLAAGQEATGRARGTGVESRSCGTDRISPSGLHHASVTQVSSSQSRSEETCEHLRMCFGWCVVKGSAGKEPVAPCILLRANLFRCNGINADYLPVQQINVKQYIYIYIIYIYIFIYIYIYNIVLNKSRSHFRIHVSLYCDER